MKQLLLMLATLLALNAANETPTELELLKMQVKELLKRIEILEAAQQQAQKQSISAPSKGTLELKEPSTVLTVGGRIQLDAAFQSNKSTLYKQDFTPNSSGNNNQLTTSMRDSRFWIKSRTPTDKGLMRTLFEFDFWGSSGNEISTNSNNIRIRHAVAMLDHLTVGQTNSLFNTLVTPEIITIPINDVLVRQPLIAYTFDLDANTYLDLSLEQPETTLITSTGSTLSASDDRLPDIGARVRYYSEWGEASLSIMLRELRQDQALSTVGYQDTAFSYGINLSSKYRFNTQDDFRGALAIGRGMGRYIDYNIYSDATLNNDGTINPHNAYSAFLAYRHWWDNAWRSSLTHTVVGTTSDIPLRRKAQATHLNLLWSPFVNALFGFELVYAAIDYQNSQTAHLNELLFRTSYDF